MIGETVSHYRVVAPLGEGGMGVVYRAEDIKLGRAVALKFLPPDRAQDRQSLDRFVREARTASALNHPNICTIYEIGEHQRVPFIAMELLDGQGLDRKIDGRPLGIDQVLDYATQLCDALEAAHDHGILHRDIKPANVFVTARNTIKVLDFGLAKPMEGARTGAGAGASEVETQEVTTRAGVALGTVAYMSPEQARGEDLDGRTDLFSLGLVLYEMATGRRSFEGTTSAVVFDAILNREPLAPMALNANVPAALERIIARAIEKHPHERYQTAGELREDLQAVRRARGAVETRTSGGHQAAGHSGGSWPSATVAVATGDSSSWWRRAPVGQTVPVGLGVVALALVGWLLWPAPEPSTNANDGEQSERLTVAAASPPEVTAPPSPPASLATDAGAGTRAARAPEAAVTAVGTGVAPAPPSRRVDPLVEQIEVARAKLQARLYDQAIADLRAALAASPSSASSVSALLLLGTIYEEQRRPDDAMAAYVELRSRFGPSEDAAEATYRLAELVLQSKRADREQAARDLLSEIPVSQASSPWAPRALERRAALEDRGRVRVVDAALATSVPASVVTYRQLVESYPDDGRALVALARLAESYEDLRRYDLAAESWLALARRTPDGARDAAWRAGELFERRLKATERAREAYALVPPQSSRYRNAQERLAAAQPSR